MKKKQHHWFKKQLPLYAAAFLLIAAVFVVYNNIYDKNIAGKAYSTSAAPQKINVVKVTASHNQGDAKYAIDGKLNTAWNALRVSPAWIRLELDGFYDITKLRLNVRQSPNGITAHEIDKAVDERYSDYEKIVGFDGQTANGQWLESTPKLSFSTVNVKYIHILTKKSPSWVAWNEIEVYGVPHPPPKPDIRGSVFSESSNPDGAKCVVMGYAYETGYQLKNESFSPVQVGVVIRGGTVSGKSESINIIANEFREELKEPCPGLNGGCGFKINLKKEFNLTSGPVEVEAFVVDPKGNYPATKLGNGMYDCKEQPEYVGWFDPPQIGKPCVVRGWVYDKKNTGEKIKLSLSLTHPKLSYPIVKGPVVASKPRNGLPCKDCAFEYDLSWILPSAPNLLYLFNSTNMTYVNVNIMIANTDVEIKPGKEVPNAKWIDGINGRVKWLECN